MSTDDSTRNLGGLVIGAIGVVFGDIGTSPLYALKETFAGHHPIPVTPPAVLGVLSLVFWTIMILVSLKYVTIIMRADNRGEGGNLALLALVSEITRDSRLAWFGLILPALVINYFGQGALLLTDPAAVQNPFYLLAPGWALVPLVVLATLATVIASQAVISGAFSVARQAVQLGYLPRMVIVQTSGAEKGQIYVPFTNWTLYLAVMALVIGFQSSSSLAAAYGIAVTGTMMIDTVLVAFVMVLLWHWPRPLVLLLAGALLIVDFAFFSANAVKILQGGWFPLIIAAASFTVLTTWKRGRTLLFRKMKELSVPLKSFLASINGEIPRPQGTAVFMTSNREGVPAALLHNLAHNKVLHARIVLVTVVTEEHPVVADADRLELTDLGKGFHRLIIKYGFMEQPDIPAALAQCADLGLKFELMNTSFFVSREIIMPSLQPGMALWREHLFKQMSKNAYNATEFFHIPTDRVVELGTQVEI